jgi:hypothetical protein
MRGNVAEIAADPALRLYGAALAATHVLGFLYWRFHHRISVALDPRTDPICWPFFEDCWRWRLLDPGTVDAVLWVYVAAAVACMALFPWRRLDGIAWVVLLALTVAKLLLLVQDYRLRLNQHYMALWVLAVFLFVPGKRRALTWLVVAFYVWAGTLKLGPDWLSGAGLRGGRPLFVPEEYLPLACAYVVVLELLIVFGLLSRRAWLFWPALGQVVLFHVASWPIVLFFYPTLMLAILTIFPLTRVFPAPAETTPAWPAWAVVVTFSLLQLPPLFMPGDAAVTGEGRLFALHMYDAPVVCQGSATLHDAAGATRTMELQPFLPTRLYCDPIVYLGMANALCRRRAELGDVRDLDLLLRSRRAGEKELRTIVSVERFCRAQPTYDLWRHNGWITP